jgi:hypothetical protein
MSVSRIATTSPAARAGRGRARAIRSPAKQRGPAMSCATSGPALRTPVGWWAVTRRGHESARSVSIKAPPCSASYAAKRVTGSSGGSGTSHSVSTMHIIASVSATSPTRATVPSPSRDSSARSARRPPAGTRPPGAAGAPPPRHRRTPARRGSLTASRRGLRPAVPPVPLRARRPVPIRPPGPANQRRPPPLPPRARARHTAWPPDPERGLRPGHRVRHAPPIRRRRGFR